MRFIDAEKLQELFLKRYDELLNLIEAGNKTIDIPSFIGKLINDAPTADVKPVVRGEWIEYPRAHYFKCNKCKYTVPYRKAMILTNGEREYNFCPHCGADMRGEQE